MTAQDAPYTQVDPPGNAVGFDCLVGVVRATRRKSAGLRKQRRDKDLICSKETQKYRPDHQLFPCPWKNSGELDVEISRRKFFSPRAGNDDNIFGGPGNFTLMEPEPFAHDPFDAVSRHCGRPEALLHHQAQSMVFQTVFDEIKTEMKEFRPFPRHLDSLEIGGATQPFTRPKRAGTPHRFAVRRFRESICSHNARRFLPFARRRLITSRPALVAIRSRKPWVRFLFRMLG